MKELKKIDVWSSAKIVAVGYFAIGVLFSLFMAVPVIFIGKFASGGQEAPLGLGILFILLLPFMYGVMGGVITAICAALYNLFSKLVGGIRFELVDVPPKPNTEA